MFTAIPMTLLFLLALTSAGSLFGSNMISVENYQEIGSSSPDSPPFCGMAWDSLDLSLITAVQGLTTDQCGACLLVCGAGPSACAYVLAVDRGGLNLDLSMGISGDVIGTTDGIAWAEWQPVAQEYCSHIYKSNDNYKEPPNPYKLDNEGNVAASFGSSPIRASPIAASFPPSSSETSTSITVVYASSAPATPTSVMPSYLMLSYTVLNPITSSLANFSFTMASNTAISLLSTLTSSFVTSTSSASSATWSSITCVCPQHSNSTSILNSSSSLLGFKNSVLSGGTNCSFSANPNGTVTYRVRNTGYNFTPRHDRPPYARATHSIRGLRWLR